MAARTILDTWIYLKLKAHRYFFSLRCQTKAQVPRSWRLALFSGELQAHRVPFLCLNTGSSIWMGSLHTSIPSWRNRNNKVSTQKRLIWSKQFELHQSFLSHGQRLSRDFQLFFRHLQAGRDESNPQSLMLAASSSASLLHTQPLRHM